ncbi:MAG: DUF934 domain-containing protein [Woeseiaceae bacterium]
MALIKDGAFADDPFIDATELESLPEEGALLINLEQWKEHREILLGRRTALGILLHSDEHPESIADDLDNFELVALDFPVFRDGRAYSYARLIRDRHGFTGELRAVGDVLLEQLHYMHRLGFNAFQLDSDQPLEDWQTAAGEFSVWYQPSGDGRPSAMDLRGQRKRLPTAASVR